MRTSKLIEVLTKSLEDNGDMTIVITTTGEKSHIVVKVVKGTTTDLFKEKEQVLVLASRYELKSKE